MENEESKKFSKLDYVKFGVSFVVGSGTYLIASAIIKDHVSPETTTQKVKVAVGTMVLASMVADASTKYTDQLIDRVVEHWHTACEKLNDIKNNRIEDQES